MRKSDWSEEELEKLLRQLPQVRDERNPNEVYQNISIKLKKRKQRAWIMPSVATAAAFLLFFILVPNLFNWESFTEKSMDTREKSSDSSEIMKESQANNKSVEESGTAFDTAREETEQTKIRALNIGLDDQNTAVYEEDAANKEVLTYAIPDQNIQNMIPVSILVNKEEGKSKFQLYEENMKVLTEEAWGLSEYFPLKANLTYDEKNRSLTVDVPSDHEYSLSSSTEWILNQVLNQMMSELNIQKLNFTTEGQPGIHFSHYGYIEHFEPEAQDGLHAYYFYYPYHDQTKPFLVPISYSDKKGTIDSAFAEMRKNQETANLVASIPDQIQFDTEEKPDEKKLIIRFDPASHLKDDLETLYTIEAILLTAKEFNYQTVKMENANLERIGRFELSEDIKVPIAPNKRDFTQ